MEVFMIFFKIINFAYQLMCTAFRNDRPQTYIVSYKLIKMSLKEDQLGFAKPLNSDEMLS